MRNYVIHVLSIPATCFTSEENRLNSMAMLQKKSSPSPRSRRPLYNAVRHVASTNLVLPFVNGEALYGEAPVLEYLS